MRRLIRFSCAGEELAGTIDAADGKTGLLIVSGGNEVRSGAHRGMSLLAARLVAKLETPVFRFDRRGVGDSTGENMGYAGSQEDLVAAAAAFRTHAPQVDRLIGFGNCDAATALALFHSHARLDGLLLANPWIYDDAGALPPAAAIRARYAERMRDPREWLRLARGGVDLRKLARGLAKASAPATMGASQGLALNFAGALEGSSVPATILLARGDNTAIAFRSAWNGAAFEELRSRTEVRECDTSSHSFAMPADKEWLFRQIARALTR